MKGNLNFVIALILIGLAIFSGIIFTSETIFGDLTETESFKPLIVILPVMGVVLWYLINKFKK